MTDETDNRPRLTPINENPDEARRLAREEDRIAAIEPLQVRIGRHFAHENSGQFCFDHTAGKWMNWTGMRWEIDETDRALDRMMTFTHRMRMLDPQNRRALGQLGSTNPHWRSAPLTAPWQDGARTSTRTPC
jgi:hypothetical protein